VSALVRPARSDEKAAVLDLLRRRDLADYGIPNRTNGELLAAWRDRAFDHSADGVVAEYEGRVAGYALLSRNGTLAFVDPEQEGLGIGTLLLGWAESRAIAAGRARHGQLIAASNQPGHALLEAAGYAWIRSIRQMGLVLERVPPPTAPPPGVELHPLDPERDAPALHEADARMFADSADYQPMPLEAFVDGHLSSPNLDPEISLVARRGSAVVGFILCHRLDGRSGFIDLLAVDSSERRSGLGSALLTQSFTRLARAGLEEALLSVASDNQAGQRLYRRWGMSLRHESDVLEKPAPFAPASGPR
jgi:mycothiol synthase